MESQWQQMHQQIREIQQMHQQTLHKIQLDLAEMAQSQRFNNHQTSEYIQRSEARFEQLMRRHSQWDVVIALVCWLITPGIVIAALSKLAVP